MAEGSAYEANRRIGAAREERAAAPAFRPRLGGSIELFGSPVTIGLEHLAAVVATGVVAGVEGVCALVIAFLGFLYLRSAPAAPVVPARATAQRRAAPPPRQPGFIGFLKYLFGPVPEGAAITIGGGGEGQP